MNYICNDCGYEFDEPQEIHTTYEHYYDAEGPGTPMTYTCCPKCKGEDYDLQGFTDCTL